MWWTSSGPYRIAALAGTVFVSVLAIIDFWLSYKIWNVISPDAKIHLSCPPEISDAEATVFGRWEGGEADDIVRVYVSPQDGTKKYWLQDPLPEQTQLFSHEVNFGNYCGFGHAKRDWPIKFDVYAFLLPRSVELSLPGSSHKQGPYIEANAPAHFLGQLKGLGARTHAHCTVTRHEPCDMPRIGAFESLESSCSLPRIFGLSFELDWKAPAADAGLKTLLAALWSHEGRLVEDYHKVGNGDVVTVPSEGLYELKLRHPLRKGCGISYWVSFSQP